MTIENLSLGFRLKNRLNKKLSFIRNKTLKLKKQKP